MGPIGFSRSEVSEIRVPGKRLNPRQLELTLSLKGKSWRKVTVELSPDEGMAGSHIEEFPAPSLSGFGLPSPDELAGLAMSYQAAQKIHAASAPHDPPEYVNRRARDVVDILLIRDLAESTGTPSRDDVRSAVEDVFAARAVEAEAAGRIPQTLPATITAWPHWEADFRAAADAVGLAINLDEAVAEANAWISSVCDSGYQRQ